MATLLRLNASNFIWTDCEGNASQATVVQSGSIHFGWFESGAEETIVELYHFGRMRSCKKGSGIGMFLRY